MAAWNVVNRVVDDTALDEAAHALAARLGNTGNGFIVYPEQSLKK
ncbi:hypothetical protein SAMN05444169_3969 [Bradyrhizobium erythrophlei]|jgi:hypothetical protein|uniref:Uncharacterized protein n=1 Tax=Bradyrhizobium erythrophlei TaxID=1437360 RepID=A0A1M5MD69_9BRAD|nr:hypothetical protein SAMN05444169_3969 [Bradyrhizobium erythrophlei]